MEPNQQKLIDDQFKTLPAPLQRAITLTPWRNLVGAVAKSNNLSQEQSQSLELESMLVMYGFESEDDFAGNVARELALDEARAKALASEVDQKVFAPVISKANELSQQGKGETLQTAPEAKPETQEIAPKVVVEPAKPITNNQSPITKPSINLIPPPPPAEKPLELKPKSIVENKLSTPTVTPSVKSSYPSGQDPYREPIN